jgi:hypothetical protein
MSLSVPELGVFWIIGIVPKEQSRILTLANGQAMGALKAFTNIIAVGAVSANS